MSERDYMRPMDIKAFQEAAHLYHVWILIRDSNPKARDYIGVKGFVPKRLDCKAKTADENVTLPDGLGFKTTAGLVVNPNIKGISRGCSLHSRTPRMPRSAE